MKITGILGVTILVFGLSMTNVEGRTIFQYIRDAGQYEVPVRSICTNYRLARKAFRSCLITDWSDFTYARFILDHTNRLCQNETDIRNCFQEKIEDCTDKGVLETLLDDSFSYCQDPRKFAIDLFLLQHYDESLSGSCFHSMFDLECDESDKPRIYRNETLLEGREKRTKYFDWHIRCFLTSNLDEVLPDCGMTRRQAYAILASSIQVTHGYGMNAAGFVEDLLSPPSSQNEFED